MLAALPSIRLAVEEAGTNSYNCYKLFGFDVLLDTKLKPWLLGTVTSSQILIGFDSNS